MGISLVKEERDQTKIGIWKVEETPETLFSKLILNDEEISFYESLNKGKRNLHWLSSRVLLRQLLNTSKFIDVKGDKYGKPHLINFDYHLSISHSYDYAAVIISNKRVGIDIEKVKNVIEKIASKFMTDEELESVGNIERLKKLYVYWSAKESLFKLNGKREINFREHIVLCPFEYSSHGFVDAYIHKGTTRTEFKVWYEEYDGYILTYVIDN